MGQGDSSAPKRPTLKDVAVAAGVSKSTVSLVLRGGGHIPEPTRERVRSAMRRLGYVYNRGAAAMREGSTRTIGVITPNSANVFMGQFIEAFDLTLVARGFTALSVHSYEDPDRQDALIRALLERGVDALAVMPAVASDQTLRATLSTLDIPLVICMRTLQGSQLTTVTADIPLSGRLAAKHVVARGCTSVGYFGAPHELTLRSDRVSGVREVLAAEGIELSFDVPTSLTAQAARTGMAQLLQERQVPEALIFHNDTIAFGATRALRDHSPGLLERTCIVGSDDLLEAQLWEPPLTTVAISAEQIGRLSADALIRKLDGDTEVQSVLLTPELIVRQS
nr:LacI family DNA-binding transcriptional regulator [Ruania zhangjianzhongii]